MEKIPVFMYEKCNCPIHYEYNLMVVVIILEKGNICEWAA